MLSKYIGKTINTSNVIGNPIELVKDTEYDIEVSLEGPTFIVNGVQQIHPDSTLWVIINGTKIPYSHEAIKNNWTGF